MQKTWQNTIVKNFDRAAKDYNASAEIQKQIALKLAEQCFNQPIQNGFWADLGSGTGLLAESLEKFHPNQSVYRVDISSKMIEQHPQECAKQVWDLNRGLPIWPEPPRLLASSFALHWLQEPPKRLQEWFYSLPPGGWLALAIPIEGSFQEWYQASERANVICTAFKLPSLNSLLQAIHSKNIRYEKLVVCKQKAPKITSLLKPIVKIGAQSSLEKPLSVKDWRELSRHWPRSEKDADITLTWLIQLLMIQR